jgi:hypothetical protein
MYDDGAATASVAITIVVSCCSVEFLTLIWGVVFFRVSELYTKYEQDEK